MKKTSSHILKAVITTIIACIIVFALALYLFGSQGFWIAKAPTVETVTPTLSGNITINVPASTGSTLSSGSISCTREYRPVCGTDGQTYSNACIANSQGAIVETEGVCKESETGSIVPPVSIPPTDTPRVCTMEYAPVCGTDGKTYSNTCMAGDVAIARIGECENMTTTGALFDSGSYTLYANTGIGYSFAMPKYSYYSGEGARDGASHTMAISTTASGVIDFATATVQVWLYRKTPSTPPSDQSVTLENGTLYIKNNDTTGNPKVGKIVETVLQSAK